MMDRTPATPASLTKLINTPLVSIIIPALNEVKYIENCLNSIFLQSYPKEFIEVFLIDGGSTDETVEKVKCLQADHLNLYLLINRNKIASEAFNLGVENAKGEIILRLDAHSIYDLNYIHYCVLNILESDYGNVGGRLKALPGSDTITGKVIAIINNCPFGLGGATYRVGNQLKIVKTVPFGAFPKKVILSIGKMDEHEDLTYNRRIRAAGYKVLFDPRIVFYYYARSNLRLFLIQARRNGSSIGELFSNTLDTISIRHIIPMFFVVILSFGLVLSFFFPLVKMIFLSSALLYVLLGIIFGITYTTKNKIKIIPLLLIVTFLVHICYGWGTIRGLIKGRERGRL